MPPHRERTTAPFSGGGGRHVGGRHSLCRAASLAQPQTKRKMRRGRRTTATAPVVTLVASTASAAAAAAAAAAIATAAVPAAVATATAAATSVAAAAAAATAAAASVGRCAVEVLVQLIVLIHPTPRNDGDTCANTPASDLRDLSSQD